MNQYFGLLLLASFLISSSTFGAAKEIGWGDLRAFDTQKKIFMTPKSKKRDLAMEKKVLGDTVRVPGYIVPVDKSKKQYMLLPYIPSCAHVPMPPVNQMIFIQLKKESPVEMGAVWVTSKIKPATKAKDGTEVGFETAGDVKIRKYSAEPPKAPMGPPVGHQQFPEI